MLNKQIDQNTSNNRLFESHRWNFKDSSSKPLKIWPKGNFDYKDEKAHWLEHFQINFPSILWFNGVFPSVRKHLFLDHYSISTVYSTLWVFR